MQTKLFIFLWLGLATTTYAGCCGGGCGDFDSYSDMSACFCVDPACKDPYSCMTPGACCAAFGNIGAMDSTPETNDVVYGYSVSNLFTDYTYYQAPAAAVPRYHVAYRGYKGE